MIELEPETMTAAPRTRANFAENGQMSEPGKTSRRQPNPPAPVLIETPETVFSAAVRSINKRFQLGTLEYKRTTRTNWRRISGGRLTGWI